MTYVFNMHEAKTKLSKLVELVEAGQEVFIARSGKPAVKLIVAAAKPRPKLGEFQPWEGWISEDFDEPIPAVLESVATDLFADESKR
jgi:prevent-host-death family protein